MARPERGIGFFDLTTLVMGSMIGSGIFFLPGGMLASLGSTDADGVISIGGGAWAVMAAWVVGGIVALCGGLMFAELGAAYPRAGGQYAFLRDSLGKRPAFLFAWTGFSVVQSGTVAAVAVAMAAALDGLLALWGTGTLPGHEVALGGFTIPKWGVALVAIAAVWMLTGVNAVGVRLGAWVSNVSTVAKVAALVLIVGVAFIAGTGSGNFSLGGQGPASTGPFGALGLGGFGFGAFALAVSATLFAYDGFAQGTFVAAEVKEARRVLPRAIVLATLLVAAIYILVTLACLYILPLEGITQQALRGTSAIAAEAVSAAGASGAWAAAFVGVTIVVSTFGTVNAYVLASPRIYHSVARDGAFPRAFGRLNRHGAPGFGLWYGAIWASLLALTGSYLALADLVVFGLYAFYLLTVVGYLVLRRRDAAAFEAFRVPLRPVPALLFGLASVGVLASYAVKDVGALATGGSLLGFLSSTTGLGGLLIASGFLLHVAQGDKAPAPEPAP